MNHKEKKTGIGPDAGRLESWLRRYKELNILKQKLLHQTGTRAVLDTVAHAAAQFIQAETVAIPMLSHDNFQVRYEHAWGRLKDIFIGLSLPIEEAGLCGWVLENRRPILTNELQDDPRVPREEAKAAGLNAAVVAPLIARGRIIGGISAFNKAGGGRFSEEDMDDLTSLADYAALIIDNARLMEELSREKQKMDAIFEGVNDGIIFISKEGIIKKANRSVERYLPLKAEDLIGAGVYDLVSMGRLEEVFDWNAKAETGSRCYELLDCGNLSCSLRETGYLRCWFFSGGSCNTGSYGAKRLERCLDCNVLGQASIQLSRPREVSILGRTLQVSSSIARDRHDEIFGEVMVIHDVTAEKDLERQRLEFVSMVTHDLKAPLTSIIGTCALIEEEKDLQRVKELIRLQKASSGRLLKMVNDFLDIKKIEAGYLDLNIKKIDLKKTLEGLVRSYKPQAKKNKINLALKFDINTKDIYADLECFKRVLENLLSNSIKYAGEGCSIAVTAGNSGERFVEVAVTDDGPGISPAAIKKLFRKYSVPPGEKTKGSSGLGLAITKELTEAQGGIIKVKSEKGKGTTFYILMPVA